MAQAGQPPDGGAETFLYVDVRRRPTVSLELGPLIVLATMQKTITRPRRILSPEMPWRERRRPRLGWRPASPGFHRQPSPNTRVGRQVLTRTPWLFQRRKETEEHNRVPQELTCFPNKHHRSPIKGMTSPSYSGTMSVQLMRMATA
jgi:hypothetical protein